MKSYIFLSLAAALVLSTPVVQAEQSGGSSSHQHQKRFGQMERKIDEAQKLHGKARHAKMMEHMQMMRDQMKAMHGMMGGRMAGKKPGNGKMGQSAMKPGHMGQMGAGGAQMMQNMQGRMDMMQKMMEQMHKQHELMLKDDS